MVFIKKILKKNGKKGVLLHHASDEVDANNTTFAELNMQVKKKG